MKITITHQHSWNRCEDQRLWSRILRIIQSPSLKRSIESEISMVFTYNKQESLEKRLTKRRNFRRKGFSTSMWACDRLANTYPFFRSRIYYGRNPIQGSRRRSKFPCSRKSDQIPKCIRSRKVRIRRTETRPKLFARTDASTPFDHLDRRIVSAFGACNARQNHCRSIDLGR